ncbi:hypothetical protein D9M71_579200 [compost metagenome]
MSTLVRVPAWKPLRLEMIDCSLERTAASSARMRAAPLCTPWNSRVVPESTSSREAFRSSSALSRLATAWRDWALTAPPL